MILKYKKKQVQVYDFIFLNLINKLCIKILLLFFKILS